jgi:hypothetical protein
MANTTIINHLTSHHSKPGERLRRPRLLLFRTRFGGGVRRMSAGTRIATGRTPSGR